MRARETYLPAKAPVRQTRARTTRLLDGTPGFPTQPARPIRTLDYQRGAMLRPDRTIPFSGLRRVGRPSAVTQVDPQIPFLVSGRGAQTRRVFKIHFSARAPASKIRAASMRFLEWTRVSI